MQDCEKGKEIQEYSTCLDWSLPVRLQKKNIYIGYWHLKKSVFLKIMGQNLHKKHSHRSATEPEDRNESSWHSHLCIFDMAWLLPVHQGTLPGQCRPFKKKIPSSTLALLPDRRLSPALETLLRRLLGSRFTSPLETVIRVFFPRVFQLFWVTAPTTDVSKHSKVHWCSEGRKGEGRGLVVLNLITVITMHDIYSFHKMMKCWMLFL